MAAILNYRKAKKGRFPKAQPETLKQAKVSKMTKEEQEMYKPRPDSLIAGLLDILERGDIKDQGPYFPDCLKPK